jgi:hypothetical protein
MIIFGFVWLAGMEDDDVGSWGRMRFFCGGQKRERSVWIVAL